VHSSPVRFFYRTCSGEIPIAGPTPEKILRNVDQYKNAHVSWLGFVGQQALLIHPLATPICLAGLWYFLGAARAGNSVSSVGLNLFLTFNF